MNNIFKLSPLSDTQSTQDTRKINIDQVGIKDIRYPISILLADTTLQTIARLSMTVGLPSHKKGTHMSRFVELLEQDRGSLDQALFRSLIFEMLKKLGAASGEIQMEFPAFITKSAPITGVKSKLDYDVIWSGHVSEYGVYTFCMTVKVPVTSLCPCSKEISDYGAHNQRSILCIKVELDDEMPIADLVSIAEKNASCEIYGILKRPDEKYVTERAYDNPKFVEDLVRDIALSLNEEKNIRSYSIEAENFESIHNHSAFARITRTRNIA
ncbi:GTP cyclohydrolase FolE2 [Methylotenera sp. G11]|uniref:GTP cyclohydrolase FolE2 n=1 Tax=Methylotenera sp. G11 TaxID=1506585 RepID=UPI00064829DC|nr:GTP cyclohydrolase FolE2 [Methylotenera sp. G11]